MPKHVCIPAAAVMLLFNGAGTAYSWYPEECSHDKDCHPVPCEEIEKMSDGRLWRDAATKQRHWFPHDRLKASHDDVCHMCAEDDPERDLSLSAAPGLIHAHPVTTSPDAQVLSGKRYSGLLFRTAWH